MSVQLKIIHSLDYCTWPWGWHAACWVLETDSQKAHQNPNVCVDVQKEHEIERRTETLPYVFGNIGKLVIFWRKSKKDVLESYVECHGVVLNPTSLLWNCLSNQKLKQKNWGKSMYDHCQPFGTMLLKKKGIISAQEVCCSVFYLKTDSVCVHKIETWVLLFPNA